MPLASTRVGSALVRNEVVVLRLEHAEAAAQPERVDRERLELELSALHLPASRVLHGAALCVREAVRVRLLHVELHLVDPVVEEREEFAMSRSPSHELFTPSSRS